MGETVHFTKVYERRLEHPVTTINRHNSYRIDAEESAKRAWRVASWELAAIVVLVFAVVFLLVERGW